MADRVGNPGTGGSACGWTFIPVLSPWPLPIHRDCGECSRHIRRTYWGMA